MKRLAIKLVLFLLLGAIVNVAVAWSAASLGQWPTGPVPQLFLREQNEVAGWPADVPSRWAAIPRVLEAAKWTWGVRRFIARENALHEDGSIATTEVCLIDEFLFGWPFYSFQTQWWDEFVIETAPRTTYNRYEGHPGPSLRREGILVGWGLGVLPLNPIWPGFAINTIFYAAVLWLVFAALGTVKRRLRHVRGRCIHCGYDLRGQLISEAGQSKKCPECGRKQNAETQTRRHAETEA